MGSGFFRRMAPHVHPQVAMLMTRCTSLDATVRPAHAGELEHLLTAAAGSARRVG
jgi:hypothetical protein